MFRCSLRENIRLGNPDATDEEVKAAARAAQCDEFIAKLPQGYDTPAGEAGKRLSGGEKQRIAIARRMLKNAPIVILDEATDENANRILVVDDGTIAECGTHEELIKRDGIYKRFTEIREKAEGWHIAAEYERKKLLRIGNCSIFLRKRQYMV